MLDDLKKPISVDIYPAIPIWTCDFLPCTSKLRQTAGLLSCPPMQLKLFVHRRHSTHWGGSSHQNIISKIVQLWKHCSQLTRKEDRITHLIPRPSTTAAWYWAVWVSDDIHTNIILQLDLQGNIDLFPSVLCLVFFTTVSLDCSRLVYPGASEPQFQGCWVIYAYRVMGQNFNVGINHDPE